MAEELIAVMKAGPNLPDLPGVETVVAGDYAAVFMSSAKPLALDRMTRRGRLKEAARRQSVLERLMIHGTVLAFEPKSRLDRKDLNALLCANDALFEGLLRRLDNLVQYQVTVSWPEERVLEHFRDAPEISSLFGAGAVSGKVVAQSVTRLTERLVADVRHKLGTLAREIAEMPRDQGILSNHVVLVPRDSGAAFDRVLEEIDSTWPDGFQIRVIGPAPGASFATLRIHTQSEDSLAQARKRLGISESVDVAAVRSARQRALRQEGCDAGEVRFAATVAEAAARTGRRSGPLHLIDIWSEGRSTTQEKEMVA